MSIVLVIGLCPSLAYADHDSLEAAGATALASSPLSSGDEIAEGESETAGMAITYTPKNGSWEIVEGMHGYLAEGEEGASYYRYDRPAFQEGDLLSITNADADEPTVYEYGYAEGYGIVFHANDEIIWDYAIGYEGSDQTSNLKTGDSIKFRFTYEGVSFEVPATIIENPVVEISYEPAIAYSFVEGIDGQPTIESDGIYYDQPRNKQDGDKFTINYRDRGEVTYTFSSNEWQFIPDAEGWDSIDEYLVIMRDSEDDPQPWSVGAHKVIVEYANRTCAVPVTITENPYDSIVFTPGKKRVLEESVDVWYEDDGEGAGYQASTRISFEDGDQLAVYEKSGASTVYTYFSEDNTFASKDSKEIDSDEVSITIPHDERWTLDGQDEKEYNAGVSYGGKTCTLTVTLSKSTIESLTFTPVRQYEYLEETHGWREEDGYFHYYAPQYQIGDTLTIAYTDGETVDYVFNRKDDDDGCFVANGRTSHVEKIDPYEGGVRNPLGFDSKQSGAIEAPGSFEVVFAYRGKESQPITVAVKKNAVTNIEFSRASQREETAIFMTDGYYDSGYNEDTGEFIYFKYRVPDLEEGDTLKVTESNGAPIEYTYNVAKRAFVNGDAEIPESEIDRYTNHSPELKVGDSYEVVFEYAGQTCNMQVKVVSSPVKAISFLPAKPYAIAEDDDGFGWDSGEGFIYMFTSNLELQREDELTVEYAEGGSRTYTYDPERQLFVDGDSTIDPDEHYHGITRYFGDDPFNGAMVNESPTLKLTTQYMGAKCVNDVTVVHPIDISKAEVSLEQDSFTYTGKEIRPSFSVTVGDKTLSESDYYVSYRKNTRAGTGYIAIAGLGSPYTGYVEKAFTISKANVDVPTAKSGLIYSGAPQQGVSGNENCTLIDEVAKDVGEHTATASLKDPWNYQWNDESKSIDDKTIAWSIGPKTVHVGANSAAKKFGNEDPAFSANVSGLVGSDTINYTIAREPGEDVGEYAITASGAARQGNYTVSFSSAKLRINAANIGGARVAAQNTSYTYAGGAIVPNVTVTLGGGKVLTGSDYTVSCTNNVNVGTATITVTGKGNYSGTATGAFTIVPQTAKTSLSLNKKSVTYTGKAPKLTATVKIGTRKATASEYSISYDSNSGNVGTHKVTANLRGNYTGSASATYTVLPASTSISKVKALKKGFTVTWKKRAAQTSGYEISYSTSKNFKSGTKTAKTVAVENVKSTSKTISKLKAKKKYYVKVRTFKTVGKKTFTSGWSSVKTVTTKK